MKIIPPTFSFIYLPEGEYILRHLEQAARTCYKSEDKTTENSARHLLGRIIRLGHDSVLEHISATVRLVCDRGVTHELVRHRLCSFSQESTRYANYAQKRFGREITVIRPFFWQEGSTRYTLWKDAMHACEAAYLALIDAGASPQEARSVLPNSLKTEIVVTANMREWRHIFRLRCDKASHPQMRELMIPLLHAFAQQVPLLFEDLQKQFPAQDSSIQ